MVHVLIVDEDPAVRLFLEMVVRENGFEAILAESPIEASRILECRPIDVVVFEAEAPLEVSGDCPMIVLGAGAKGGTRRPSASVHRHLPLPRPFGFQEFERVLVEACRRSQRGRGKWFETERELVG
jgi:DNA-binding NarL/FixJ family response regulator